MEILSDRKARLAVATLHRLIGPATFNNRRRTLRMIKWYVRDNARIKASRALKRAGIPHKDDIPSWMWRPQSIQIHVARDFEYRRPPKTKPKRRTARSKVCPHCKGQGVVAAK